MADKVSGPPGGGAVFLGHVSRPPVQGAQLAGREVSVVSEGSPFTKISTSVKAIKEAATGIIARVAGATTSPVFLARVDDLGELLQGVDISKMPTELRKELLGLMSITRKAFEALGIPHVKLSENIAKLEQMTQGFLAVQEFNEAVKDLGSGKKLTFDTQQKLVVTKRKPFAWVKQLLGKVGTSTRSDAAGIALITKLDRAHENGKNLTEAECEECYKSILALEQNGWFKGCLGHTGALYRERFEKAKEYFYFRVHGQRAADNLEAAFNEKIHSLEDKIKGLEAKISVLKQGQQDKERKKELGGLTIALKTASDELKAMRPSKEKMMWYLRENAASMIKRAEQSRVGGVTASKSETGLPYSLRCFKDKESGNFFFEISFGSFAHGGEANIKELVDLETGEKKVKKTLLRSEGVGEAEVRQKKIEKETGFVQKLVRAKVPGVVEVEWETYEGKGGVEKKRPTSKKYEGGTLRDYTESTAGGDPAVNLQKNKSIATQVVRTVYHMHQQGVVHHDLKEDNVLLDTKGTTGLIDFGAAGKTGGNVQVEGTPGYFPPEMLMEEQIQADPKQDLWSLGMLLLSVMSRGVKDSKQFKVMSRGVKGSEQFKDRFDKINRLQVQLRTYVGRPDLSKRQLEGVPVLRAELENEIKVLRDQLKAPDCPIEPPYNTIIAGLLDPDPDSRMTDRQLADQWPGFAAS